MDKRAIARIVVGTSRGTGFLVSRQGLVLTALHVVADLDASRRNERLKAYADPIWLTFGDPLDQNTWSPAGPASVIPSCTACRATGRCFSSRAPSPTTSSRSAWPISARLPMASPVGPNLDVRSGRDSAES